MKFEDYESLSSWTHEFVILAERHAKQEFTNALRWQTITDIGCGDYRAARDHAEKAVHVARQRQAHDREAAARMLLADVA